MFIKRKNLLSPQELKEQYPIPAHLQVIKSQRDEDLRRIFSGEDERFLLIIGPCSADDPDAVCDYVSRLAKVAEQVKDDIFIVPRIYTNKPRTNGKGYKGMLHQPNPEKDTDIFSGIVSIRQMHLKALSESHLSAADEMLYPENLPYMDDFLSYHAIGARSVENQEHRLVASGVDVPVGMKNPTSGDLTVMFNSILAAQMAHIFLYRQEEVETTGNPFSHGILRGSVNKHGDSLPNYHYEDIMRTLKMYQERELENPAVIIDVNHANSGKNFAEQPRIVKEILSSRRYNPDVRRLVKGLMIESYIEEGSREISNHVYGKSITDACLGWADSEQLILRIADRLYK